MLKVKSTLLKIIFVKYIFVAKEQIDTSGKCQGFSAESGFPLGFVRRYCREGKIPHWKLGKVYMMDYDTVFKALVECSKPSVSPSSNSVCPNPSPAGPELLVSYGKKYLAL